MIIDIPTQTEFHTAGLNQLLLAWEIVMQVVEDYDEIARVKIEDETSEQVEAAKDIYWRRSQPVLANAYSLIQHGMELALKGLIAKVSPLILIGDPSEWSKRAGNSTISFGEFRTLDAVDLVNVHNSMIEPGFDNHFKTFWEGVRRNRNKIMHSSAPGSFDPGSLIRTILTAVKYLFNDEPWPAKLLKAVQEGRRTAFGDIDYAINIVAQQINQSIEHLDTAEVREFFGYDKKRRPYLCPFCYNASNKDFSELPHLAQFPTKEPGETLLSCVVCKKNTEVERIDCQYEDCRGNVIASDTCLTCDGTQ